jgi:hypothetical protein
LLGTDYTSAGSAQANPRQPLDLQANNLVVLINKQTDKVNQRAS